MISIIGNLKIDESKPERVKYLLACIKSFDFLGLKKQFIIALDSPSWELERAVKKALLGSFYDLISYRTSEDYGIFYCRMLEKAKYDYVLNFMEDHFCVMNDVSSLKSILDAMYNGNVDITKCTFHTIETNSAKTISPLEENNAGTIFLNDDNNFKEYQRYYGERYYIGCNFITTKSFAKKFWERRLGKRPHEYEITNYSKQWEHICMIPKQEILAAIDDAHGEPGTDLLSRQEPKFIKKMTEFS